MRENRVFEAVAQAVHAEVLTARGALGPWSGEPPTALLLNLCDLLEAQVASLQRPG
jgi:hypothetical protein